VKAAIEEAAIRAAKIILVIVVSSGLSLSIFGHYKHDAPGLVGR
jgi:hypothetical protein